MELTLVKPRRVDLSAITVKPRPVQATPEQLVAAAICPVCGSPCVDGLTTCVRHFVTSLNCADPL